MTKEEKAIEYFSSGFNCSQSVFTAIASDLGLDKSISMKIATGFGGGMGRQQSVCGAVTGAIMAIGFKYGNNEIPDKEIKEKAYQKTTDFIKEFGIRNKSIYCMDILGYDMKTPEGTEMINKENLFATKCAKCVKDAVEIAGRIINDK